MAKSYRPVLRDQPMLLPVDMREWLPQDHLVWFVLETVEALDISALERTRRRGGAGAAGYDPKMLLGLLVYAYCQGVRSSRAIERMCTTDVAFRPGLKTRSVVAHSLLGGSQCLHDDEEAVVDGR
jgi:transposase